MRPNPTRQLVPRLSRLWDDMGVVGSAVLCVGRVLNLARTCARPYHAILYYTAHVFSATPQEGRTVHVCFREAVLIAGLRRCAFVSHRSSSDWSCYGFPEDGCSKASDLVLPLVVFQQYCVVRLQLLLYSCVLVLSNWYRIVWLYLL